MNPVYENKLSPAQQVNVDALALTNQTYQQFGSEKPTTEDILKRADAFAKFIRSGETT